MPKGVKTPMAVKVEYVEWLMSGAIGKKGDWARAHQIAPETLSRMLDDEDVQALIAAVERGQERRFGMVIEKAYRIAADPDHMHWPAAANFLAKVHGKYKPDKIEATVVDRVAYVQPGTLREAAVAAHPEAATTPQVTRAN